MGASFRTKSLLASLLLCAIANHVAAKPVVVEDVLGRKVTVDAPAKRVMLGFYIEDYSTLS